MRNAGTLRRSWGATTYMVGGLRTALPALLGFALIPFMLLFSPLLFALIRPVRALAGVERRRAARALGRPIPPPYAATHTTGPERSFSLLSSSATWREIAWLLLHGLTGVAMGVITAVLWPTLLATVTVPIWWQLTPARSVRVIGTVDSWPTAVILPLLQCLAILAVLAFVVPGFAYLQRQLAASLLGPSPRAGLAERVEQLTQTRAEALKAHGAELRRIERDLHDGTQAQLVALAMRLSVAERRFERDPEGAHKLLAEARDGAQEALAHLRTAIRGIYPPILSDRGLAGAITSLAAGQPIPVALELPPESLRVPAAVEAAAYFTVAEALTNLARHSDAAHAQVTVHHTGADLRILVRDDGRGGADPAAGSGLAGIRQRVAALDGTTRLDSRPGAGTTIEVNLPCGS
ncbi:sensor histidine kinase [Streptomyces sp. NPDC001840]